MDKNFVYKVNQDYNEDRVKLIHDPTISLNSKIKKHDILFRIYCRKLNTLRENGGIKDNVSRK